MTITTDKMGAPQGTGSTASATPAVRTHPATDASAARPLLAHDKRRALGRGLESLLPGPRPAGGGLGTAGSGPGSGLASGGGSAAAAAVSGDVGASSSDTPVPGVIAELQAQAARKLDGHEVLDLLITSIDVNPHQTRSWTRFEVESLEELSDSIRAQGVLQPVTVRPGKEGRYFLITGERRLRASTMAGKATIPAIVRIVSEQQAAEMTVIENLQRRDLNCIDLARAYIMLSQDFGLTQEQIGQRVGIARETVSNYMRLAKLPREVQTFLNDGELDYSHARVLLNLEDPDVLLKVARRAVAEDWSVDKLEKFVLFDPSMFGAKKKETKGGGGARWVDPNVRAAQRDLERILAVKVRIRDHKGKGKITLEYATLEDFDRVLGMLKGKE
jgi:ParB family transcriptional regulator, chromosome partitioning protein